MYQAGCNTRDTAESFGRCSDVFGETGIRSTDGAFAAAHVSPVCREIPRTLSGAFLLASGSIPVHGLRAVDLSGEPARYRDLPASALGQALPLGYPGWQRP